MTDETDRLAVAAAFREACARHRVHYEGLATNIERWASGRPPEDGYEWPGPPRDDDTGIRRREACVAAIREAARRRVDLPGDLLVRMIQWSWPKPEGGRGL